MRLLYLTPSYPPKIGGGERYAQAVAQAAAAAGHEVTVVTTDVATNPDFWRWHPARRRSGPQVVQEDGITVIRCPATGLPGGWATLTMWRKAMVMLSFLGPRTRPLLEWMSRLIPSVPGLDSVLQNLPAFDIVHGYNLSWEHPLMAGWRLAQRRGTPHVVTPFAHLGTDVSARVTRNITMAHQMALLNSADAVLALPSAEADGLIALGVPPERVHAVGSGYDRPAPTPAKDLALLRDTSGPLVLFVGRISRDKGAMLASEAIRRLATQQWQPPTLVLVGPIDRAYARYYQGLSAEDQRRIRLVGPASEADKQAYLERATMLVLPSRVDSFGMVFLEAWSHGKPVIGARAGGIPGVIDDGRDGLLVPWGDVGALSDAIAYLLTHPDRAREMGEAGQMKTNERYTWSAVWTAVERIYANVLAERGTPR
jgi:glycogen synthase